MAGLIAGFFLAGGRAERLKGCAKRHEIGPQKAPERPGRAAARSPTAPPAAPPPAKRQFCAPWPPTLFFFFSPMRGPAGCRNPAFPGGVNGGPGKFAPRPIETVLAIGPWAPPGRAPRTPLARRPRPQAKIPPLPPHILVGVLAAAREKALAKCGAFLGLCRDGYPGFGFVRVPGQVFKFDSEGQVFRAHETTKPNGGPAMPALRPRVR